jgi:beta-phosphoglucomutase
MKSYEAVLFDMDGVVVDSMPHHASAWMQVLGEFGVTITREEIYMREGMSGRSSIIDIFRDKKMPVPDDEGLGRLIERKLSLFEDVTIGIFKEVPELVGLVRSRGLATGLVTGSLRRSVDKVLAVDIRAMFDVIITVDDVKRGKPDPEPYLKAAILLNAVPGNALVVENAPMGIRAAKSAGMDCYALVTTLGEKHLESADKCFHTHANLLQYMRDNLVPVERPVV